MFYAAWNRYNYLKEFRRRLTEHGPEDDRVLRFIEVNYPDPDSKEAAYDELEKAQCLVSTTKFNELD
jgi:hypothetical protein